ncbi:SET domain-containing protein 5 [Favolaschia claudopus]|uniref:SET domain-containing protein 5 n=1 Tax=Favolaschia claudopus TaxID=2862362 RepID=A0AAW0B526_9AGAR
MPSVRPPKRQRQLPSDAASKGTRSASFRHRFLWLAVPAVAGLAFYLVGGRGVHTFNTNDSGSAPEITYLPSVKRAPYIVADLPGKGKGLVAIRDIKQGELVIQESPLFTVPTSISRRLILETASESPGALIARLLRNTPAEGRDAFLNLSYVNFPAGVDPKTNPDQVALAIFQTNAVAAGEQAGIFPGMARLNHGCSSAFNVVYTWREREQQLFVYALRDVQRGQTQSELGKSEGKLLFHHVYINFLSQQYGFKCTCAVCSLDDAASQASDERLTTIARYYVHFASWGSGTISGVEAISTINKIWSLEEEEGYWSERGRLAADAAWIAASHSDASAARLWAQLAIRWYTYEVGADSDLVSEVRRIAADPEEHPAWSSREPLVVGGPLALR